MNDELALRTLAYLTEHYKTHNETIINSQEIDAINFILEEIQELKKQLEEKDDFVTKLQATKDKLDKWDRENAQQQKEFIDYLENLILKEKDLTIIHKHKEYLKEYEEILSKYKEIIGGKE